MEQVTLWNVLVAILVPAVAGGFALIWARIAEVNADKGEAHNKLWAAVDNVRKDFENHRIECERRYVLRDDLSGFKKEILEFRREMLSRLDRIENKIDRIDSET